MTPFIRERTGKLIEDLGRLCRPLETPLSGWKIRRGGAVPEVYNGEDPAEWEEFPDGGVWGGRHAAFFFAADFVVPPGYGGRQLSLQLTTGREGEWDATNPQFALYVDGALVQGMDVNHTRAVLTENAEPGARHRLVLGAFSGSDNRHLRLDGRVQALCPATRQLYYDLKVPYEAACLLPPDSEEGRTILTALNRALNLLDLRREHSAEYLASVEAARAWLEENFYRTACGQGDAPVIHCVGHTHIDVAWLWTLDVTRDKTRRSFATALELMRRYPEFLFMSSQPQLYRFVQQHDPALWERIRRRVREGRWEPEGGMWVEADCNIAGGEALVRQFLHGIRFFEREFGKRCRVLWLPDVFGYSAALPQIMRKCGIRYFMTTKLSWNEYNQFPMDTFRWEGLDGSRVLAHFVSARDYVGAGAAMEGECRGRPAYYTTYNGILNPSQIKGAWQRYQQKELPGGALFSFGYGDGGGGATEEMLETQRRLARGIPGCPQTRMTTAAEFFRRLESGVQGHRRLPEWVGELYLEYHRGTLTSMARQKRYNRKSELALQSAEMLAVQARLLCGEAYPAAELSALWETLLLNQFHDILPGTSIGEVYEESSRQYEALLVRADALIERAAGRIARQVDAPAGSLVVFNPGGGQGPAPVRFPCGEGLPVIRQEGKVLAVQRTGENEALLCAEIPPHGYAVLECGGGAPPQPDGPRAEPGCMENRFFRVELDAMGRFTRIYDKRAGREALKPGSVGNALVLYEDRPHNWDAWDINSYYTEHSWPLGEGAQVEVAARGPVFASLRIRVPCLDSLILQTVTLWRDIPRIDVEYDIDWREKQLLLKSHYAWDVHAAEAAYDIQFGNVTRPTHANTSWDAARFEVCMHQWMDVSEEGFGVAVLNDCKYGVSVRGSDVGLTLLKSAVYPNPAADRERHRFTFSVCPHAGGWRQAEIPAAAQSLNSPPFAVAKTTNGGGLPGAFALAACEAPNVRMEAVKQAEAGGDIILRLYENQNRRTQAAVRLGFAAARVAECNLLEEETGGVAHEGRCFSFTLLPYEIKTFRIRPCENEARRP